MLRRKGVDPDSGQSGKEASAALLAVTRNSVSEERRDLRAKTVSLCVRLLQHTNG